MTFLLLTALSLPVSAETRRIHSMTETMIKFTNGEVAFWKDEPASDVAKFFVEENQMIEVELEEDNRIKRILPISMPGLPHSKAQIVGTPYPFEPTVLPNYAHAQALMNRFNRKWIKDSECYNRAHVWAYEAFQTTEIQLQKVFVFWSDHYIEKHRFKWWFHVAPMALVNMKGAIEERVMDARFAKYPLKMKLWTNSIMTVKAECKVSELYTDYSHHPDEDDCYILKTNMYSWQPRDLEEFSQSGFEKSEFIAWEIRHAYEQAFGIKFEN